MLFISRYIGEHEYGVVDTDDWVEEACNVDHLLRVAEVLGNNAIHGLYIKDVEGRPFVDFIIPYQLPEQLSPRQVKLRTLYGIELKTYRDMITDITFHTNQTGMSVRLSDYGSKLGDYVLCGVDDVYFDDCRAILILDDKIEVSLMSFGQPFQLSVGVTGCGVVFDIREVTRQDTLDIVYAVIYSEDGPSMKSIIDNPERIKERVARLKGNAVHK